ncbi:sodium/calcium exchanger regulatory protein 1-like [Atheta coriaria]|uniref:sodium/calcium exchanger regulatory protein 1-like n=1 Tax=Dalotia coriaria TaxID=877792 RepID=UPI0031F373DA
MSIVAGKYEFTKQENGKDFYAGVGVSAEFAEKSETTPCTLEVIVAGSKVTLNTHYTGKVNTVECQMGQEFKDKMPNGLELDSTPSIDGNKLIIKSNKDGNYIGERVYEFTGSEVIVSISSVMTPAVCKRFYKK